MVIPVPEAESNIAYYDSLYPGDFKMPKQLIHLQREYTSVEHKRILMRECFFNEVVFQGSTSKHCYEGQVINCLNGRNCDLKPLLQTSVRQFLNSRCFVLFFLFFECLWIAGCAICRVLYICVLSPLLIKMSQKQGCTEFSATENFRPKQLFLVLGRNSFGGSKSVTERVFNQRFSNDTF